MLVSRLHRHLRLALPELVQLVVRLAGDLHRLHWAVEHLEEVATQVVQEAFIALDLLDLPYPCLPWDPYPLQDPFAFAIVASSSSSIDTTSRAFAVHPWAAIAFVPLN